jgi:hypothetical protein
MQSVCEFVLWSFNCAAVLTILVHNGIGQASFNVGVTGCFVRTWQAAFPCVLLVCWQSRSLHYPLRHSVCAFSGACTAVMLVVVEVVLVDVGVVLVFGMAFVVVVVVVFGVFGVFGVDQDSGNRPVLKQQAMSVPAVIVPVCTMGMAREGTCRLEQMLPKISREVATVPVR